MAVIQPEDRNYCRFTERLMIILYPATIIFVQVSLMMRYRYEFAALPPLAPNCSNMNNLNSVPIFCVNFYHKTYSYSR